MSEKGFTESILVVDDDREFLRAAVSDLKWLFEVPVFEAKDGTEALEVFRKQMPAVIVLDLILPKRSGFLVVEEIKKESGRAYTSEGLPRIIMVTVVLDSRHKVYAKSLGVSAYMTKPFEMWRLIDEVKKALEVARGKI